MKKSIHSRAIPWKENPTPDSINYVIIQITGTITFWFKNVFLTLTLVHFYSHFRFKFLWISEDGKAFHLCYFPNQPWSSERCPTSPTWAALCMYFLYSVNGIRICSLNCLAFQILPWIHNHLTLSSTSPLWENFSCFSSSYIYWHTNIYWMFTMC